MAIEGFSWLAEVGMQQHGHLMVSNNLEEIRHHALRPRPAALHRSRERQRPPPHPQHDELAHAAQGRLLEILLVPPVHRGSAVRDHHARAIPPGRRGQDAAADQKDLAALQPRAPARPRLPLLRRPGVIPVVERTELGDELLNSAKDTLWAAQYGTIDENVLVERELLVITIPGRKAFVFKFFQSVTEVGALGSWRDPTDRCHDEDMPNMLLQVEYGESASEVVGNAIMVAIHVINLLEVNEVVLYARSSNIEQSTLFTELYFQKLEMASTVLHADSAS